MLFWWILGSLLSLVRPEICRNVGATCASCSSVSLCVSVNSTAIVAACSRPTPYCNAGSCSAAPGSKECIQNFTSFVCPEEDGSYPDGTSCTKYHICLNGTAHNISCTVNNSVYSPGTGSCVRQTQMRGCHKVTCKNPAAYAVYPGDHTLFFLCVNSKPTLVLRCAKGLRFDQSMQSCVVKCENEGRFIDPMGKNNNTFVECTQTGPTTYVSVQRTCPANSIFDDKLKECVFQYNTITATVSSMTDQMPNRKLFGSVRGYNP
uniref:Chitin-binding type-2 domain-containing protein n=1 Tax=Lygus hesperus TaxID=30085 RepID=A0A146KZX0_LYGHE